MLLHAWHGSYDKECDLLYVIIGRTNSKSSGQLGSYFGIRWGRFRAPASDTM